MGEAIRIEERHGVRVAIVRGTCAAAALADCDIVYASQDALVEGPRGRMDAMQAQRAGVLTRCVPPADLDAEAKQLLDDLAAKDPLVVRFTQRSLRQVGAVPWDGIVAFNTALQAELRQQQSESGSPRAAAVASFLAGKSKPGLGG